MSKKDEINKQLKDQKEKDALEQKAEERRAEDYQDIHDLVISDRQAWATGTDIVVGNVSKMPLARGPKLPGMTTFSLSLSISGPTKLTPMRVMGRGHSQINFSDTTDRAKLILFRNVPHQLTILPDAKAGVRVRMRNPIA